MSKINELGMVINELRKAATVINDAADDLTEIFSSSKIDTLANHTETILTLEQVRAVLADKSRAGLTDEVRELLKKYGADRLSKVDPSHYADLMKDAEVL